MYQIILNILVSDKIQLSYEPKLGQVHSLFTLLSRWTKQTRSQQRRRNPNPQLIVSQKQNFQTLISCKNWKVSSSDRNLKNMNWSPTGFETEKRFRLFTYDGNMMLTAKENSGLLRRINLSKYRSMEINVENMNRVEVLRFERDVPMFSCLFPCCFLQTLEVFSGRCFIGSVEKIPNCINFNFKIRDENGVAIMKIKGPSCFKEFSSCFQNVDFGIFSLETQKEVGHSSEL